MYFKAILLKKKKPNVGLFRNRIILINAKTKEMMTVKPGLAIDWLYFEARGWTHWLKLIPRKELLSKSKL